MKNVHILSTNKPSRLYKIRLTENLQLLEKKFFISSDSLVITQNIYITSDEEIEEGDWCFYLGRFGAKIVCKAKLTDTGFVYQEFGEDYVGREDEGITPLKSEIFKIILTTDQDLIKDGVQAIDDEFLKWFVKNPSCESVEVVFKIRGITGAEKILKTFGDYTIILPKEQYKQETLEKASEKKSEIIIGEYCMCTSVCNEHENKTCKQFEKRKKMYSEEEVLEFTQTMIQQYKFGNTNIEQLDLLKESLEQFKSK